MKNRGGPIGPGAILVLALCFPSSVKGATGQTRLESGEAWTLAQQQAKQPSQEFQGTVTKAGTKYILDDKASGATYELDNQDKARQFVNKDVKVTGTLDPSTNTIEVAEIQEVK